MEESWYEASVAKTGRRKINYILVDQRSTLGTNARSTRGKYTQTSFHMEHVYLIHTESI